MEQNKNRYSKFKLSKFEIIMLIIAGVFLILAIVDKVVKSSAADYFGPSDVEESDVVLQSYDGQTALVPQSYIDVDDKRYYLHGMNYVNDRFYPVYMSDDLDFIYTNIESNKKSITYYTSNSEGGFVGSFVTDQGVSGIDYFIIRGMIWNVRAFNVDSTIPVGSKGISYAPVIEWQFSASSILYWVVGSGNSASYYALSSSDLTFDIDNEVIQLKSGVTYNLVTWDPDLQDWDLVSTTPTQNYLDSLPITSVIRLKGPRFGIVLYAGNYIDFDISYFSDDLIPSPTPTSVPISSSPEFSFFAHGKPFWQQSLVENAGSQAKLRYYLIDVFASNIFDPLNIEFQGNPSISLAMSEYGVAPPWVRPAVVQSYDTNSRSIYIYFSGNLYGLKIYDIGEYLPTHNMSFIRDNFTAIDWDINTEYSSSFYAGSENGLNCVSLFLDGQVIYGTSETPTIFDLTLSRYGEIEISGRPFYNASYNSCFNYNYNNSINSALVQGYRIGLDYSPVSDITPTPDPNAPTLSPSPTPLPYVIVITEPVPTPINWIDYQDPDYPKLKPGDLSSGFDDFENKFSGGKGLSLLAVAYSFIPAEIRSIMWLILLIAVILATIRVFLHFFG